MAGDWIKTEHTLPDKPEVDRLAGILGIDHDAVVGKLIRFWIWGDQQSVSGDALSVTETFIDRVVSCAGFAKALQEVGWLQSRKSGFLIPNFDRHNGKSAKARALTKSRMQRSRDDVSVTKSSPEKRREEKNKTNTGDKPRFVAPTVEEVGQYCRERANGIDPQAFVDFYESKGWKIGKNSMKDWQASVRTWERNRPAVKPPASRVPTEEDLANWNPHAPIS
jgi:hypothetical protein